MSPVAGRRARLAAGSLLLLAPPAGLGALAADPDVRGPALRVARVLTADLARRSAADRVFVVAAPEGVRRGAPAFVEFPDGSARPVAHVREVSAEGVRLRFEPGEDPGAPRRLVIVPATRTLGEALALVVPESARARLLRRTGEALERVLVEGVGPEVGRRLPGLGRRLDPSGEGPTRELLDAAAASVLAELEPLLDGLVRAVSSAVERRFDFLARVGLLWKILRGDARGLERELTPVAKEAAKGWWASNEVAVLGALGRGLAAEASRLETWLGGELWSALREEVLAPALAAERGRLEAEGEALLAELLEEVAVAPRGGFRLRFAAALRQHLLGRRDPLLLLVPEADGG